METNNAEVAENRKQFFKDFKITRLMRGNLVWQLRNLLETHYQECDHKEVYATCDGRIVFVISPYREEISEPLKSIGFRPYASLYGFSSHTWFAEFTGYRDLKAKIISICPVQEGKGADDFFA